MRHPSLLEENYLNVLWLDFEAKVLIFNACFSITIFIKTSVADDQVRSSGIFIVIPRYSLCTLVCTTVSEMRVGQ